MKLLPLFAVVALAACSSDFERAVQDHQRRLDAFHRAEFVADFTPMDPRIIQAFRDGCGGEAIDSFNRALDAAMPTAMMSRAQGEKLMVAGAGAFEDASARCLRSLHANGEVRWRINGLEVGAVGMAREFAELVSFAGSAGVSNSGGCGSRGGPGYRLASGKCAGWLN